MTKTAGSILLVDDEAKIRNALAEALREEGHEVVAIGSPREAQRLLARGPFDVLLVDTAGRLAIDEALMREIKDLHAALNPVETLFVVDAMQGQDAINTAKAFKDALPLTGVVLTKLDGDARGGAALSVRQGGVPEDIANTVAFFAGEESGYVTGQVIYVDGGRGLL